MQEHIYNKMLNLANYELNERIFIWQGWVDKYLRSKKIYPNDSIHLGSKKFKAAKRNDDYPTELGLEHSRHEALKNNIREKNLASVVCSVAIK